MFSHGTNITSYRFSPMYTIGMCKLDVYHLNTVDDTYIKHSCHVVVLVMMPLFINKVGNKSRISYLNFNLGLNNFIFKFYFDELFENHILSIEITLTKYLKFTLIKIESTFVYERSKKKKIHSNELFVFCDFKCLYVFICNFKHNCIKTLYLYFHLKIYVHHVLK